MRDGTEAADSAMKSMLGTTVCIVVLIILATPLHSDGSSARDSFPVTPAELEYQISALFHFRWVPSGWTGNISYAGNLTITIVATQGKSVVVNERVHATVDWPRDAQKIELSYPTATEGRRIGTYRETSDRWTIGLNVSFTDRQRTSPLQNKEWVEMYACQHKASQGSDWARTSWGPESLGQYTIEWIGSGISSKTLVSVTSFFSGQTSRIFLAETGLVTTSYGRRESFYWLNRGQVSGTGEGAINWSYMEEYFWDTETGILLLYRSTATSPDGDAYSYTQILTYSNFLMTARATTSVRTTAITTGTSTRSVFTEPRMELTTATFETPGTEYSTLVVVSTAIAVAFVALLAGYAIPRKKPRGQENRYIRYVAKLEELKARSEISEDTYLKLKKEFRDKLEQDRSS